MSTHSAPTRKNPPPAIWRWAVLVAISVAMYGNYYVYDSVAPVADLLQKLLGYSDTQLGRLNAIYHFPNIVMVLVDDIQLGLLSPLPTVTGLARQGIRFDNARTQIALCSPSRSTSSRRSS